MSRVATEGVADGVCGGDPETGGTLGCEELRH